VTNEARDRRGGDFEAPRRRGRSSAQGDIHPAKTRSGRLRAKSAETWRFDSGDRGAEAGSVKLLAASAAEYIQKRCGSPCGGRRIVYCFARSVRAECRRTPWIRRAGQKHPGKIRKRRAAVAADGRTEKGSSSMASAAEQALRPTSISPPSGKPKSEASAFWFTLAALVVYAPRNVHSAARHRSRPSPKAFLASPRACWNCQHVSPGGPWRRPRDFFALNIMPYIFRLDHTFSAHLGGAGAESVEEGRPRPAARSSSVHRYLTVVLATFRLTELAIGLEGQSGVVTEPGLFFGSPPS